MRMWAAGARSTRSWGRSTISAAIAAEIRQERRSGGPLAGAAAVERAQQCLHIRRKIARLGVERVAQRLADTVARARPTPRRSSRHDRLALRSGHLGPDDKNGHTQRLFLNRKSSMQGK